MTSTMRQKLSWRANRINQVRRFFARRDCIEVDTPLLRECSVTDPYMRVLKAVNPQGRAQGYLQTSPEYAMKILLAQGAGDIYQLGKMFRADEQGQRHAIEFTMLEWYRLGWDHWQLMEECLTLIKDFEPTVKARYLSYDEAFWHALGFAPGQTSSEEIEERAHQLLGELPAQMLRDDYLSLLFDQCVEPSFPLEQVTFVYGYPPSQAALARVAELNQNNWVSDKALELADGRSVACRFEIFWRGLELANGFFELTDADEQLQRFTKDNEIRRQLGYPQIEIDEEFMAALKAGLPACSGVAMGLDRLLMALSRADDIGDVIIKA